MQRERWREGLCTILIIPALRQVPFLVDVWALLWVIFIGFPERNGVYTLSFTDLLSEAMEQNPHRKSNGHSASQIIPRISGNQKAHYCTHKKRPSLTVIPSRKCRPNS
jgi:hypothetical protein